MTLPADDTVVAIASLRRSFSRITKLYTGNHSLTAMASQRFLLASWRRSAGIALKPAAGATQMD